jgi:hypothetical protein
MENCVKLPIRLLGLTHQDAEFSSQSINTLKEKYSLLLTKQVSDSVLAEYHQT